MLNIVDQYHVFQREITKQFPFEYKSYIDITSKYINLLQTVKGRLQNPDPVNLVLEFLSNIYDNGSSSVTIIECRRALYLLYKFAGYSESSNPANNQKCLQPEIMAKKKEHTTVIKQVESDKPPKELDFEKLKNFDVDKVFPVGKERNYCKMYLKFLRTEGLWFSKESLKIYMRKNFKGAKQETRQKIEKCLKKLMIKLEKVFPKLVEKSPITQPDAGKVINVNDIVLSQPYEVKKSNSPSRFPQLLKMKLQNHATLTAALNNAKNTNKLEEKLRAIQKSSFGTQSDQNSNEVVTTMDENIECNSADTQLKHTFSSKIKELSNRTAPSGVTDPDTFDKALEAVDQLIKDNVGNSQPSYDLYIEANTELRKDSTKEEESPLVEDIKAMIWKCYNLCEISEYPVMAQSIFNDHILGFKCEKLNLKKQMWRAFMVNLEKGCFAESEQIFEVLNK
eukprot:NODE_268_length_11281_cov_0.363799.p4 type:complete len:451 gc:universal NODE_268_length_11281_cov_0.363799:4394-3042(-)